MTEAHVDTAAGAFMDRAAIIRQLDLVVMSDTAIAHLSGPLGVPVWVVLPFAADWRWLLDESSIRRLGRKTTSNCGCSRSIR